MSARHDAATRSTASWSRPEHRGKAHTAKSVRCPFGIAGLATAWLLILLAQGRFLPPRLRPASAASPDARSA
jgi:hypothetical protein